jgi:hypothetical protein
MAVNILSDLISIQIPALVLYYLRVMMSQKTSWSGPQKIKKNNTGFGVTKKYGYSV